MAFFESFGNGLKQFFSGDNFFGKGSPFEMVYDPANWWDRFKNGNASDIARENLGFQRENLDYQKAIQQKIFEREDTAYQRTANDMRMAGLNPLAMSGTNNAGEVVPTEPLHNQMTDTSNMAALGQIFNVVNQMRTTQSNSSLQDAQANLINAQAENQEVKNLYETSFLENNLRFLRQNLLNAQKTGTGIDWDNKMKNLNFDHGNLNYLNAMREFDYNNTFGITPNMSDKAEEAAIIYRTLAGKSLLQNFNVNPSKNQNGVYNFTSGFFDNSDRNYGDELKNGIFKQFPRTLDFINKTQTAVTESKLGSLLLKLLGF